MTDIVFTDAEWEALGAALKHDDGKPLSVIVEIFKGVLERVMASEQAFADFIAFMGVLRRIKKFGLDDGETLTDYLARTFESSAAARSEFEHYGDYDVQAHVTAMQVNLIRMQKQFCGGS